MQSLLSMICMDKPINCFYLDKSLVNVAHKLQHSDYIHIVLNIKLTIQSINQ